MFGLSSWISPYTSAGESLEKKRLSHFLATQGRLERREESSYTKPTGPTGTLSSTNRPGASTEAEELIASTSWERSFYA